MCEDIRSVKDFFKLLLTRETSSRCVASLHATNMALTRPRIQHCLWIRPVLGTQGSVHKGCQMCMIKTCQVVQHPELGTQGRYCSKFCSCIMSWSWSRMMGIDLFFHLTLQSLNCGIIARKMSFNLLSFLLYLAFSCNLCLKINCPIYSGNNHHDDVEV